MILKNNGSIAFTSIKEFAEYIKQQRGASAPNKASKKPKKKGGKGYGK